MANENPLYDNARLHSLQVMLAARINELLAELGVGLHRSSKMFYGACPVHGGDNPNGFNLYPEGESVPGYWRCYTRRCHDHFARNLIGFVRGVLSRQKHDWLPGSNAKKVKFGEAVAWSCKFLGVNLRDIAVDHAELEKLRFVTGVNVLTRQPEQRRQGVPRSKVRAKLQIPADYFLQRGWSAPILDRYDVGLCTDPGKPFHERVVVPIYDEDYQGAIGFTARSVFEQCGQCRLYHAPNLSCSPDDAKRQSKWTNSEGFHREHHLYNWWFSKKTIRQTGTVCLVEGPGDIWRLEEAGIRCGVAMLGAELTDPQQILLERSGALNVVVLTDMDDAGRLAAQKLKKQLGRCFRVYAPDLPAKDLGELDPGSINGFLSPLLEGLH